MTKQVTCLFLGSGASDALARIPMQRAFLRAVLTKGKNRRPWIDSCEDEGFRMNVGGRSLSSWMFNVEDVELCMSHLHNVAYPRRLRPNEKLKRSDGRRHPIRALINFRTAIADFLLRRHVKQRRVQQQFHKWLKALGETGNDLVIVTTNYDLVLERLLRPESYYYPHLRLVPPSTKRAGAVRFYKLHGSVNWLERRRFHGSQIKSYKPPKVEICNTRLGVKPRNWGHLFERKGRFYSPILIAFFYQKEAWLAHGRWKNLFRKHWNSAENVLTNGLSKIYFIGYSLPPADHYMLTWLLSILNKTKPDITIVRKGADKPTTLEKALKPFNPKVYECGLEGFLDGHV
jgi:hypothetical protein